MKAFPKPKCKLDVHYLSNLLIFGIFGSIVRCPKHCYTVLKKKSYYEKTKSEKKHENIKLTLKRNNNKLYFSGHNYFYFSTRPYPKSMEWQNDFND